MKAHVRFVWMSLTVTAFFAGLPSVGGCMENGSHLGPEAAVVHLPEPRLKNGASVEQALLRRRSVRSFRDAPLSLADIGQLLWAAQGVTSRGHRAAPSAGALYPLELYVVAGKVAGLAAGVYRYVPETHTLVKVKLGDRRSELSQAAWRERAIVEAPASLLFSAVFERTTKKYGERGNRYVYMDEGHAAENAIGVGTVVIGGFDDAAVAKAASLPAAEKPLAIMPVGREKVR